MKNIMLLIVVTFSTISCINYNILPTYDDDKLLTDKNGYTVKNCDGSILFKKDPNADIFWEKNNLPKGTAEFVCVNGKAYLPGKEPKQLNKNIKDALREIMHNKYLYWCSLMDTKFLYLAFTQVNIAHIDIRTNRFYRNVVEG